MELYLLRHGDAMPAQASKGGDAQRPLSEAGAARVKREADALALLRLPVQVILTSPLVRARQTAEIVARRVSLLESLHEDDRLSPGFGEPELAGILREHRDLRGILLVGHEPDFSRVISACIGGGKVECGKGSLARVDIEKPGSLRGVLAWLLPAGFLAPDP
jgi:phosphohistidine phosphatase